jgi:hypothetical protein
MLRTVLALLIAASCLCVLGAATTPPPAAPKAAVKPAKMIAKMRDGAQVEVKPLNSRANPYRGQYGEWDRWVYEHYDATIDPATYQGG